MNSIVRKAEIRPLQFLVEAFAKVVEKLHFLCDFLIYLFNLFYLFFFYVHPYRVEGIF